MILFLRQFLDDYFAHCFLSGFVLLSIKGHYQRAFSSGLNCSLCLSAIIMIVALGED